MMSKKISLLLLFLTYALVLVHGVMPHQHHQDYKATKQHSHGDHSHSHDGKQDDTDKENPLTHYFHSLAQGEPHFPGKEDALISKASSEATTDVQIFDFNSLTKHAVQSSTVYVADSHSPPDAHHFSRRGPPSA